MNEKEASIITLREYQEELIHKVRHSIKRGHKRIVLQAWVGSGKTLIAAETMKLALEKLNKSLFLAPRRQLVYQASETFHNYGINNGVIMAGVQPFGQPLVQVGSIDTLTTRIKNRRMEAPHAKICVVDECHAAMSETRVALLENYEYVIGITSTPALSNGRGLGAFYTDLIEGPSMEWMVDNNFLVPMRYYGAAAPDLSNVKLNADGDYQEKALGEASDKPELVGAIFENNRRLASDRTSLIFAVNCDHARHIYEEFRRHNVPVCYIDANTPTDERDQMKRDVMSDKIRVCVNIGVMAFGTDWPRIDCIQVARCTKSIIAWIQMVGRGTRLFDKKNDCICIYHGTNFHELGRIDDPVEWSLSTTDTLNERREARLKEKKEPKDIVCPNPMCGHVFRSRRDCPRCGSEAIDKGKPIPFHQAELSEIIKSSRKDDTKTPAFKKQFYAEMLGYCRRHSKPDKYALAVFRGRYAEWPNKKNIAPQQPSQKTLDYIKSRIIAYAKSQEKNKR